MMMMCEEGWTNSRMVFIEQLVRPEDPKSMSLHWGGREKKKLTLLPHLQDLGMKQGMVQAAAAGLEWLNHGGNLEKLAFTSTHPKGVEMAPVVFSCMNLMRKGQNAKKVEEGGKAETGKQIGL
jgi:hypothetical protein